MTSSSYEETYQLSISDPGKFWDIHAQDVIWTKPYTRVLDEKESVFPKWFVGGEINMCYNCLDRQVEEGYGDEVAIIYESPIRKIVEKSSYKELLEEVKLLAGVMVDKCGVKKGDRVLFYMPMIPQCLIGILACTRIGAIHSVINAGFGYKEIASRIKHFEPKLILTSNGGSSANGFVDFKSKIDSAIKLSTMLTLTCIVYNLPEYAKAKINKGIDLEWDEEISKARPQDSISVESRHPIFVNYTSGTTGDPKGLVFETGGATVAYKYYMKYVYNLKSGETSFVMSSFSWILGVAIMSFGALMSRNPTIIYDGKPSDRNDILELIRMLNQHEVVSWTCTPTIMRIMMKHCDDDDLRMTSKKLAVIHLAGEVYSLSLKNFVRKTFKCSVYDGWGQTELGFGIAGCLGYRRLYIKDPNNIPSVLLPGIIGKIVDGDTKKELPKGTIGRLILKLPLHPSRSSTMFKSDQRFSEIYFKKYPGYYDTMDSAIAYEDHIKIISRDDDVIHVASTRINGTAVQMACLLDDNLEHAAVVALEDSIKGFVPFAFLVPKLYNNCNKKEIIKTAIKNVSDVVGEVACFERAVIVPELPINVNGKLLKSSLDLLINGKESKVPQTVTNSNVYKVIYDILCEAGYHPQLPS